MLSYQIPSYRQVTSLCKAFANSSSKYIKLSKTQQSKIIQSSGFLGRLIRPLMKVALLLVKNVLVLLARSVLVPLGLTGTDSAGNAGIHKKH